MTICNQLTKERWPVFFFTGIRWIFSKMPMIKKKYNKKKKKKKKSQEKWITWPFCNVNVLPNFIHIFLNIMTTYTWNTIWFSSIFSLEYVFSYIWHNEVQRPKKYSTHKLIATFPKFFNFKGIHGTSTSRKKYWDVKNITLLDVDNMNFLLHFLFTSVTFCRSVGDDW